MSVETNNHSDHNSDNTEISIFSTKEAMILAAAQHCEDTIVQMQQSQHVIRLVLTGGSQGIGLLEELYRRHTVAPSHIDWKRVVVFFGDERYVNRQGAERNLGQADRSLLNHVPISQVFGMPASDDGYSSIHDAAEYYENSLREYFSPERPTFDIHLLGMGDEGHINSLFPHSQATEENEKFVVAVTDSPKPPPERITLTFPAIACSRHVWFLVAGRAKAEAVKNAVTQSSRSEVPAAGARGIEKTLWFIDESAASCL